MPIPHIILFYYNLYRLAAKMSLEHWRDNERFFTEPGPSNEYGTARHWFKENCEGRSCALCQIQINCYGGYFSTLAFTCILSENVAKLCTGYCSNEWKKLKAACRDNQCSDILEKMTTDVRRDLETKCAKIGVY